MKTINAWLLEKLNSPYHHLAHCMLITRKDGQKIGFTDHSADLVIDGITYTKRQASDPSEIQSNSRAAVDNMEIIGVLLDDGLNKADILRGAYDDARLDIFLVDYTHLPTVAVPGDCVWLKVFLLGNTRIEDNKFFIECRSLTDLLNKNIIEVTSPTCRVRDFGDARCKKDLSTLTHVTSIVGHDNDRQMTVTGSFANGYFVYGKATFTSGENEGYVADIAFNAGAAITLYGKPPLPMSNGDTLTLVAGCDRLFETCISFNNVVNFRGEPHIPGVDKWKAGYQEVQ